MSKKKSYPMRLPIYGGGIRLQGLLDRNWWAVRWRESVEEKSIAGRYGRARNYALSGQVVSLDAPGPHVEAKVVGARAKAYSVSLDFRVPEGAARKRIVTALRSNPMLVARILAGELPMEAESIFRNEGTDLLPGGTISPGVYDVTTSCSCPDYANPCKHALAVMLVLGEEVSVRPALLLKLRGVEMEELYEG